MTLVCFGTRFGELIAAGSGADATAQPYTLSDLVLEGLRLDVDSMIWKINRVLSTHERVK